LVDIDASVRAIERALLKGDARVAIVAQAVAPDRRTEELTDVRFDHVLGMFETPYDRSNKSEARTYNLRLAASKLDGTVLLPGEVFDFNRVVGPRDEANGYKVAPVIAEGELVDGIGGGTCQISGTLHGAAYFAGLEVVVRYAHTRPSSYIKLGLDATVVYPKINFRFRNPFDHPVVLHELVANGVVRAEILGPKVERTVTMIRRIEAATPYEQAQRNEPRHRLHARTAPYQSPTPFTSWNVDSASSRSP
jgi:vancomycin resistance protein YoaR